MYLLKILQCYSISYVVQSKGNEKNYTTKYFYEISWKCTKSGNKYAAA